MLFAVNRRTVAPSEGEMDQPFLAAIAGRAGKARHSDCQVGAGAVERAFSHRPGDGLRHGLVLVEQISIDQLL